MNINKELLDDANKLKRLDRKFADLTKEADSILARISEEIIGAHTNGKRKLELLIPSLLKVQGFTNKESQLYVYAAILKVLEEKNYRARIKIDPTNSTIFISWNSAEEELELNNLKEFLKLRYV